MCFITYAEVITSRVAHEKEKEIRYAGDIKALPFLLSCPFYLILLRASVVKVRCPNKTSLNLSRGPHRCQREQGSTAPACSAWFFYASCSALKLAISSPMPFHLGVDFVDEIVIAFVGIPASSRAVPDCFLLVFSYKKKKKKTTSWWYVSQPT